jgi:uncharacterized coiled-coil protein SlyX
METLEYNHNDFNAQQAEQDRALLVKFYTAPLKNEERTLEEGRPIFDDVDMIEIRVRGTKDNIVNRPVRADDKVRFREAWRHHQDGEKAVQSGTPLAQWPVMATSQVEEMKYLGFVTVEQIAEANDSVVSSITGLQTLKNKAKAFIEFSKGAAPIEKLQTQLADSANVVETLQRQLAETQAALTKLSARMDADNVAKVTPAALPKK